MSLVLFLCFLSAVLATVCAVLAVRKFVLVPGGDEPLRGRHLNPLMALSTFVESLYLYFCAEGPVDFGDPEMPAISTIREKLSSFTSNLPSMTRGSQERCRVLLEDAQALIDAAPVGYKRFRMSSTYYLAHDFTFIGEMSKEALAAWSEKAKELAKNMEEFTPEYDINVTPDSISSLTLRSSLLSAEGMAGDGRLPLPQVATERLSPEEEQLITSIQQKYKDLPLIEANRVQRALNNVALAQELQEDLAEEKVTTVNGEPVEELVKRITQGNLERVGSVDKVESEDRVQALAHDLQVLDVYTKDLPRGVTSAWI